MALAVTFEGGGGDEGGGDGGGGDGAWRRGRCCASSMTRSCDGLRQPSYITSSLHIRSTFIRAAGFARNKYE